MALKDLIQKRRNRIATATPANVAILAKDNSAKAGTVARIATIAIANTPTQKTAITAKTETATSPEIEEIKNWLINTGRPPEDYLFQLIIDKCQNDAEALKHFLQYSRTGKGRNHLISIPAVSQKHSSVNDIERVREWLISIGEPEQEQHLVLEKCRNDPEAMAYFMKHVNGEFK